MDRSFAAAQVKKIVETAVPFWISPARDSDRFFVTGANDNKTAEANHRFSGCSHLSVAPDLAKPICKRPCLIGWIETDNVEPLARCALGAHRRVDPVPDRWMRLLQRFELHRHIVK